MGDRLEQARPQIAEGLALAQGLLYASTGFWPLISYRSFVRVTGPKKDDWLVKTVGLLVGVTGISLMLAGSRRRISDELALLAAGEALALAGVDVYYACRGRISRVYLIDAIAEGALVAGWGWWATKQ